MKKFLIALALFGTLGLGSCSGTFNPSVDFGDKTYINDYSNLVKAVNDLSSTLDARLSALNSLIEKGFYDVKVAVDANTNAITIQTTALKDGLEALNTTILDGFTQLNATITATGDKIITAINANGDLIALHLDSNGKLIEAAITANTTAIVESLSSLNNTISEKFDALNTAMTSGLAELTLKTAEIGAQLVVTNASIDSIAGSLNNMQGDLAAQVEKIGQLSVTLFDGFKAVETQLNTLNDGVTQLTVSMNGVTTAIATLDANQVAALKALQDAAAENNGKLIAAINEQGQLIVNVIDALNKIIETKVFCNCGDPMVDPV